VAPRKPFNKIIREALDVHFRKSAEKEEAARLVARLWRATRKNRNKRLWLWVELQHGSIVKLRDWIDWALRSKPPLPRQFLELQADIQKMFDPIRQADNATTAPKDFLLKARKAEIQTHLPEPYLTYLLLVELMGYRNLGTFEKISWSVPLDVNGRPFLVEHRKFGLGIFVQNQSTDINIANQIANKINRACRKATPFFEWHAQQHLKGVRLNVNNKSKHLFERYEYFLGLYSKVVRNTPKLEQMSLSLAKPTHRSLLHQFEKYMMKKNSTEWLALATIDAFFSWTEHVFIHIAIMRGSVFSGEEVAWMATEDWAKKFKNAIDLDDRMAKRYFDQLVVIRKQLRNFVAHGAFGKNGEAFQFHSPIGAIPVTLSDGHPTLKLTGGTDIDDRKALKTIKDFISFLWSGERTLMKMYIQDTDLPLRPAQAKFGEYAAAMKSRASMKAYIKDLQRAEDKARNMDF